MRDFDDDHDLRHRVQQLAAIVESSDDAIAITDRSGAYQFVNRTAADYLGVEPDAIVGATHGDLFCDEVGRERRRRERVVLETERTRTVEETLSVAGGERVFETTRSPYYGPEGDLAGVVTIYRDVTDRKVRERTLEDQRDQLATLNRINEVAQQVVRGLIGEPTREEIARTVCDRLVESELYRVAWVGEPAPAKSALVEVTGAGLDEGLRESLAEIDLSEASDEPVAQAYHEDDPRVVQNISDFEALADPRREALLERDVRSGIVVPIRYGDTTYGVLAVGSNRLAGFSNRETAAFEVLGEVIGFAISAVKHRQLALSDTVAELEFRLTDPDSFYVAASECLGCTIELEGMAAGSDGTLLFYDFVTGTDPESVASFAEDWDAVEEARLVSEHCDRSLLEFTVSGASVVLTLSEYGARPREAVTADGEGRIVAELPADADVREVVEGVQSAFSGVELVAKRERERDVRTAREFRRELDERLTDAQRTALRAAYFAGYYSWPRDSTAEEIADSLDISSPTLHQHIRKAQQELLATFFDNE